MGSTFPPLNSRQTLWLLWLKECGRKNSTSSKAQALGEWWLSLLISWNPLHRRPELPCKSSATLRLSFRRSYMLILWSTTLDELSLLTAFTKAPDTIIKPSWAPQISPSTSWVPPPPSDLSHLEQKNHSAKTCPNSWPTKSWDMIKQLF